MLLHVTKIYFIQDLIWIQNIGIVLSWVCIDRIVSTNIPGISMISFIKSNTPFILGCGIKKTLHYLKIYLFLHNSIFEWFEKRKEKYFETQYGSQ